MRKNLDENIKRQLEKKMTHFIKYFPVRIRNVGEDAILNRQLMWDFKDGKGEATERVAQMTADYLKEEFGESVADILLVTIPASTQAKNETRYKNFCNRVSELTRTDSQYTSSAGASASARLRCWSLMMTSSRERRLFVGTIA